LLFLHLTRCRRGFADAAIDNKVAAASRKIMRAYHPFAASARTIGRPTMRADAILLTKNCSQSYSVE
jgi:hypothetical protein